MHSANSERPSKGALHPIQESAQTAQAVNEISKGLQCALTAITIVALWQLPHLGHGIYIYIYIYYECMVDNLQFLRVLDYRSILIILKNKFTNNSVEQAVSS